MAVLLLVSSYLLERYFLGLVGSGSGGPPFQSGTMNFEPSAFGSKGGVPPSTGCAPLNVSVGTNGGVVPGVTPGMTPAAVVVVRAGLLKVIWPLGPMVMDPVGCPAPLIGGVPNGPAGLPLPTGIGRLMPFGPMVTPVLPIGVCGTTSPKTFPAIAL